MITFISFIQKFIYILFDISFFIIFLWCLLGTLFLLLLKIIRKLVSVINKIWIFGQRCSGSLEKLVHYSNCFLICFLKLRVKHIYNILNRLISNNCFKRSAAKMSLTFRTVFSVRVFAKELVDTWFAKSIKTFIYSMSIPVKTIT